MDRKRKEFWVSRFHDFMVTLQWYRHWYWLKFRFQSRSNLVRADDSFKQLPPRLGGLAKDICKGGIIVIELRRIDCEFDWLVWGWWCWYRRRHTRPRVGQLARRARSHWRQKTTEKMNWRVSIIISWDLTFVIRILFSPTIIIIIIILPIDIPPSQRPSASRQLLSNMGQSSVTAQIETVTVKWSIYLWRHEVYAVYAYMTPYCIKQIIKSSSESRIALS